MPVSVLDANFNSFQREIIPLAQEQGIGVIGMKSLANGHLFEDPAIDITAEEATPLRPLAADLFPLRRHRQSWPSWSRTCASPASFVPMTAEEQTAAIDKVFHHAWAGQHEPFKTSHDYEGNEARKEHGLPVEGGGGGLTRV